MIYPTERYIFKNSLEFFQLKHDIFVQDYLSDCIMAGDALNETPLKECSLVTRSELDVSFCNRILNSLLNSKPLIQIHNICTEDSEIIFDIYYINNFEDIEDFYCVKTTKDFVTEGITLYQIMEIKIKSLDMINDFWLTSSADTTLW